MRPNIGHKANKLTGRQASTFTLSRLRRPAAKIPAPETLIAGHTHVGNKAGTTPG